MSDNYPPTMTCTDCQTPMEIHHDDTSGKVVYMATCWRCDKVWKVTRVPTYTCKLGGDCTGDRCGAWNPKTKRCSRRRRRTVK